MKTITEHKQILVGIVGSHAYGLATENSDIDLRGIFVAPTQQILGIYPVKDVIDLHEPQDICLYELRKFIHLACQNNPNILELLYLPDYEELTEEGQLLIDNRAAFLSSRVKDSYCGYAISQIKRLNTRAEAGDASFASSLRKRYSKHARHCFRLLQQGYQILTTGELTVAVDNREELFWLGEQTPEKLEELFMQEYDKLKHATSVLPDKPDLDTINQLLLTIRNAN